MNKRMNHDVPVPRLRFPVAGGPHLRVGVDTVHIPRIQESLARFGERFLHRLFTAGEIAYARAEPVHTAQRLAARFACKEATIKALGLADRGVNWRDIEALRRPDGGTELALHGRAAARAAELGVVDAALSLSHDGDQAIAFVACLLARAPT